MKREPHEDRKDKLGREQRELTCLQACFLLAGLTPATFHAIPNGYTKDDTPWYEVETMKGTIIFGWRRSVIIVDWSKTGLKIDPTIWGKDPVVPTREEIFIHAYGYGKAIEYLSYLQNRWPHLEYQEDWLKRELADGRDHKQSTVSY